MSPRVVLRQQRFFRPVGAARRERDCQPHPNRSIVGSGAAWPHKGEIIGAHPNAQRTQRFLDIYASGDRAALGEFLADDVVWHVAGNHRLSGDYRGRDAALAYFDEAATETDGSPKLEPLEVLASDDHGAIFLRVTGQVTPQLVEEMFREDAVGTSGDPALEPATMKVATPSIGG